MSSDIPGNEQHIKDQEAGRARTDIGELFGLGPVPTAESGYEYKPAVHILETPSLQGTYTDHLHSAPNPSETLDLTALPEQQAIAAAHSMGENVLKMRSSNTQGELRHAA